MPCPKLRGIERGRPELLLPVGQARNSVSSRRLLRVLPSHLQLDTGGRPRLRTSHLGTSSSVRHSSSHSSLVHPRLTTTTVLPRIVAAIIVGNPDTMPMSSLSPGRTSRVKAQASVRGAKSRSPWCKSSRVNSTSPPWLTSQR
jgi:hypothetical protein